MADSIYAPVMVLNDGTNINISEGGLNQHFITLCGTSSDFKDIWDLMTEENLSHVEIMKNGNVIVAIEGMHLTGTQTLVNNDGTLTCHFYMEGGVEVETEFARAGRILLGEE